MRSFALRLRRSGWDGNSSRDRRNDRRPSAIGCRSAQKKNLQKALTEFLLFIVIILYQFIITIVNRQHIHNLFRRNVFTCRHVAINVDGIVSDALVVEVDPVHSVIE